MKPMLPVLLLLLFIPAYGQAPSAEDIRQGRRIWTGYFTNENDCKNCHGVNGEGGFASALAGHQLTNEQFLRTTREGAGMTMPGFTADKNLSDQEIFQIAAYLRSLPGYTGPRPNWRTPILPSYTTAQQTYIEAGCGQCHAAWAHNPRRDMGALGPDADFRMVAKRGLFAHDITGLRQLEPPSDGKLQERPGFRGDAAGDLEFHDGGTGPSSADGREHR